MSQQSDAAVLDTGLLSLTFVASYYRVTADVGQLRHELTLVDRAAEVGDILRAARLLKLKARHTHRQLPEDLADLPLPAIVGLKRGGWGVLLRRLSESAYVLLQAGPEGGCAASQLPDVAARDVLTGSVILVSHRHGAIGELARASALSWVVPTLWRYRKPLAGVLVASLVLQLFALVTPLCFQLIVDKVLVHRSLSTLTTVMVALIAIGIFDCILQHLRTYILAHTTSRVDVELGARLFDHLTRLPVSYFETRAAGQIVARVRELETIRAFLTGPALTSVIDLLFSVIFFAVLFSLSPPLALVVLCSLPAYIGIALVIRPVLKENIAERFNRASATHQYLVETVIGIQTLKSAAVEPTLRSQWEDRIAAYVRTSFQAIAIGSLGQNAIQLVNKITVAAILFLGAQQVMAGQMSVGALIAFNMLLGHTVQPIVRLSQLWQDFQQTQVSVERLSDILDCAGESRPVGQAALPVPRGDIDIKGATFRYRPDLQPVLRDLDLSIKAGEVIGVVGASGSGKSTLAKLLQRFYRPEKGQVLIDGIDVAHVDPAWLRRHVAVVQQDSILFHRSVHDNIALANPSMTRSQVIEVARLAGADEFIAALPLGYDTMIEERGANLSGGQRQRIAIARALATRPRILILDEATSALDYESERIIRQNMRRIVDGRTVIVIAHRLAAVVDCDRIVALKDGTIVEDGSHEQLVANADSVYGKLWRMQSEISGRQTP